jgi:hypothetical protein
MPSHRLMIILCGHKSSRDKLSATSPHLHREIDVSRPRTRTHDIILTTRHRQVKVQVDRIQITEEKNPEKTYQSTRTKYRKKENAPSQSPTTSTNPQPSPHRSTNFPPKPKP